MEWEYASKPPRWTMTVGPWRAVVERAPSPGSHWSARVEHLTEPQRRTDGPVSDDPMRARAWCLSTIAELRSQTDGPQRPSQEHNPEP